MGMLAFELHEADCITMLTLLQWDIGDLMTEWERQYACEDGVDIPNDINHIVQAWEALLEGTADPPAPGTVLQLPQDLKEDLLTYCNTYC